MHSFEDVLRLYDYALPPERIAQAPATPRDSARLLVYRRAADAVEWSTISKLPALLPPRAVLVLNETKVIPARLPAKRSTGGQVLLLYLGRNARELKFLSNRRLRPGEVLRISPRRTLTVLRADAKVWFLKPSFSPSAIRSVLHRHGIVPLPPYINRTPLSRAEVRRRYQTVFAKTEGSIAAPTASLHFTRGLLQKLERSGVSIARVTLHVHLGTFSPLTEEHWKTGKLHPESYSIDSRSARLLAEAKRTGRPIIAVGTTALRALESAADGRGRIVHPQGVTRLFVREPYRFRIIDGLLTNFHVPKSSLLMLVAALTGREKILGLYDEAIRRDFRFFSFGDAMLILQ